ncbi:hypothetical protein ACLF3G_01780 [Falsiroseomonas sp. HC035]|uniref:hypothetical protein n=1 Tax=Falsiroseomonas sp. HC035 TaxID=3390999 RepID=UPI003D3127D2
MPARCGNQDRRAGRAAVRALRVHDQAGYIGARAAPALEIALDLSQFAAGLRLEAAELRMPTSTLDRYFSQLFAEDLRRQAARFALAALAHAALHRLNHKYVTRRMAAIGWSCRDSLVFDNAFRNTHPDLHCEARAGLSGDPVPLPEGRTLAAAFFEGDPPSGVLDLPGLEGPLLLCALLPAGARIAAAAVQHHAFADFTLAVRS